MPKVGKMRFPYTEQGMKEARKYSADSRKPMQIEKYQYGGGVPRPTMRPGGGRPINPRLRYGLGAGSGMAPRRPRPGGPSPLRHPGGPGGYHVRYKKGGKVK